MAVRTWKSSRLVTLAVVIVVVAVLYLARGVLIPFALAMLVSFLLTPLVVRLQRWHFPRVAAVTFAMLLVIGGVGAASWLVVGQVRDVSSSLTQYEQNIRAKLITLHGVFTKPVEKAMKTVEAIEADLVPGSAPKASDPEVQTVRVAAPARTPIEVLRDASRPALDILLLIGMVLLFAFVMLLRRDDFGDRFIRIMGSGQILLTTRALEEAGQKVSSYLWRVLLLNSLHGAAVALGLLWIGVPNALLWGLLSAILRFIPYLGPWIAAAFPVLTALAVSSGWSEPLIAIGMFVLLELISNNVLEPWIHGKGAGISPLAILASTLFWTWLWGPVGLVLATPITVCLVVMGKYVPELRFLPLLFGDAPGLLPPERLYQRLIAGDQEQAWLVLRAELAQRELYDVYDNVVLPALSMAERDRMRGVLDDGAEARIEEIMRLLIDEAREMSNAADASAAPAPAATQAVALRVHCIPARGAADALAVAMLRQVLERDGAQVEVSSTGELSGETLELLRSREVDIVCLSAMPPSRFMHVRYLCKKIASQFPELPIVAGMWTLELDSKLLADPLLTFPGMQVVTTLQDARNQVRLAADATYGRRQAKFAAGAAPGA